MCSVILIIQTMCELSYHQHQAVICGMPNSHTCPVQCPYAPSNPTILCLLQSQKFDPLWDMVACHCWYLSAINSDAKCLVSIVNNLGQLCVFARPASQKSMLDRAKFLWRFGRWMQGCQTVSVDGQSRVLVLETFKRTTLLHLCRILTCCLEKLVGCHNIGGFIFVPDSFQKPRNLGRSLDFSTFQALETMIQIV